MKAKACKILFVALCVLINVGCTHNNGNIGPLFGLWHATSIKVDGTVDEKYDDCLYFAFQSSVFSLTHVDEEKHEQQISYASWSYQGKDVLLEFSESHYSPLRGYGFEKGLNLMKIESDKGDEMVFSLVNSDDIKYEYAVEKW